MIALSYWVNSGRTLRELWKNAERTLKELRENSGRTEPAINDMTFIGNMYPCAIMLTSS